MFVNVDFCHLSATLLIRHTSAMICVSYSIFSHVSVDFLLLFVHIA